jgi:uncharacterized protein YunC (DUF1805 family)
MIAHAAGNTYQMAGVSGLSSLEAMGIPGAAASAESCRIADGLDIYENGTISHLNSSARKLGISKGMSVKEATQLMLAQRREPILEIPLVEEVFSSEHGRIMTMGSVNFATEDHAGDVVCGGSHQSRISAELSARYNLRGCICNDAGVGKDEAGISGISVLEAKGIPGAAVSTVTAKIGDGNSTYYDGVITALNDSARKLGVVEGMPTTEAARLMLEREL